MMGIETISIMDYNLVEAFPKIHFPKILIHMSLAAMIVHLPAQTSKKIYMNLTALAVQLPVQTNKKRETRIVIQKVSSFTRMEVTAPQISAMVELW